METIDNYLGFDADYMRKNPEFQKVLDLLTVGSLEKFHKELWSKELSEEDPITGALLAERTEE